MNLPHRLHQPHPDRERGDASVFVVLMAPVLVVVAGLVVDGAGQVQAQERAIAVAQSAARAGVNGGVPDELEAGVVRLNPASAQSAAQTYLGAAGVSGSATASEQDVTVSTSVAYQTKFLSIIGITTLEGTGTGSAQLLSEPQ